LPSWAHGTIVLTLSFPSPLPPPPPSQTHTIYGSKSAPGLTPRGVRELFGILERQGGRISASVSLYMLELYQVRAAVEWGEGGGRQTSWQ
jgi:hypothetical protein